MRMNQIIWPSVMAKTQSELDEDLNRLKGIKNVHLDIVDGKFAKNRTFQFPFRLRKDFCYNVHLMVNNPKEWICKHKQKVQLVIFHPETVRNVKSLIRKIKPKMVGLALKPEITVSTVKEYLPLVDYVLILTAHPGFYGAKFLKYPLRKIKKIRKLNPRAKIIIDGGISPKTIKLAKTADYFVSGSFTTKAEKPKERIKELMKALGKV